MTDLLSRPILRVPQPAPHYDRPVALVAAVGAGAVAVVGIVLCLAASAAGWFAADSGSFGQAVGVGALIWLIGNGSGVSGAGLAVTVVPLGFVLVGGWALHRVGRWAASTSRGRTPVDLGCAAAAMVAVYAGIGVVLAAAVDVRGAQAPMLRTAAVLTLSVLVFGGTGLLRGADLLTPLLRQLPEEARAAGYGGVAGLLGLVAASAAVFVLALVAHFSTGLRLAEQLHAGFVGGLLVTLVGVALVPNAVLWSGAFIVGPGFSVGTGTQVSPSGVHLGLLPDVPILAALPTSASAWWLPGLVLLPVLAGGLAGVVAIRHVPAFGLDRAALRGALAGLCCGVSFGALTILATGSFGPGRLSSTGPAVLATTAVASVACTLGGAVAAVGYRWRGVIFRGRATEADPT